MTTETFIKKASYYATRGEAFVFAVDFECKKPMLFRLNEAKKTGCIFQLTGTII